VIVGREIAVSALREWMAFVGERSRVRVQLIGKIKTVVQIIAIIVLLLERDKGAQLLRFWLVGETLLVIAAILTIWSGLAYLRAAWPALRMDTPAGSQSRTDSHG
ncbi:MAG TPA: CDP-alcohol phosphatidyltransferase family protein, partial [Rhodanobacteraceae bacterium]